MEHALFERPPQIFLPLWEALANITAWFDWEALGAIGTVGALWFALLQSTRTARSERAHKIAVLTTLSSLVSPLTELVPHFDEFPDDSVTGTDLAPLLVAREAVDWAISGVQSISIPDAACVDATQYVTALPVSLETLKSVLPDKTSTSVRASTLNYAMKYIVESSDFFSEQLDILRHGVVLRWINKIMKRRHSI